MTYEKGTNIVVGMPWMRYPVGELLCRIFQGDTLTSISQRLRNCINYCPMRNDPLTQDTVEDAENYIRQALLYDDFVPAQLLAQGSFIRCMEHYRALDSETVKGLLAQEIDRSNEDPMLFKTVCFDSVGSFLRLCYNNYLIDLINALTLFIGMAAVKSGTASEEESAAYEDIRQHLNDPDLIPSIEMQTTYNPASGEFGYSYVISSSLAMAVFEFSHLADSATKVMRCQNPDCRKFFTAKRTSAKYCPFESPQRPGRRCNDYYPQYLRRKKTKADELLKMEKNALSRLYMDRKRHPKHETIINGLISDVQIHSPGKREEVLRGELSKTDYEEWLKAIRRNKEDIDDE